MNVSLLTNDVSWQDSHRPTLAAQATVQIECGADQREVCKGLRKIAQRLALSPGLFRVKPEMIGKAQHPFKQQPGLIQLFGKYLAGAGQPCLPHPEVRRCGVAADNDIQGCR